MANSGTIHNSVDCTTNICHRTSLQQKILTTRSSIFTASKFYVSFTAFPPFHQVWRGASMKNNRLSTKTVATADFPRGFRERLSESKSRNAISKDLPVSGAATDIDARDENEAIKDEDIRDPSTNEIDQNGQGVQRAMVPSSRQKIFSIVHVKKNVKDVERDVVDSGRAEMNARKSERVKSEQINDKEKLPSVQDLAAALKQKEAELLLKEQNLQKEKAEARRQVLENLAKGSASTNTKLFFYPNPVKAGQEIEIFLNRSETPLADEPRVLIMGAFNDWRWNSFVTGLHKSNIHGDWWTCKLSIPKEAYKIDFIFFNGNDVYENNDKNDFFIMVEDGMDKQLFEDFLLEEKRRELERLAAEQAAREREAAEQRRLAEEKAGMEEDRAEAKRRVDERRQQARRVLQRAVKSVDGLWRIEPANFKGGNRVKLYYNRSSRPLAFSSEVWFHGGYNNWQDGLSIVHQMSYLGGEAGDWCCADVMVPKQAFMLNWVFADGPPGSAKVYDNNGYQDFHAIVPEPVSDDLFWLEEEHKTYQKLQEERREREEAARRKVEKKARLKAEMKEKTLKLFLQSQKHIVYTEPIDVVAGESVTVFYNPSNTVLNGKDEVWFRCSFNRWQHRLGCLPPQKMILAENGSHLKATVKVPLDAYMMDFVFSERGDEQGGLYDNRNGMDYHVPVVGGVLKEPPMHIVHIAVEMAPIAKVGGLGDVVTSLSRAVQDLGHNVEIIIPKYNCLDYNHVQDLQIEKEFSWGGTKIKVWQGKVEGLCVHFIEPENGMFWVGCIYGRKDDGPRFEFFCHSALEFLLQSGSHPDIIHCHDWSSAPVAWLFQENYKLYGLANARVVFTIHNLEFGTALIGKAMAHAHKATTVSYTYAHEVSRNSAIAPHLHKFHGILNGIDPDIWDPYSDHFIPMSYTNENVVQGKKAAKEELQRRLGLKQVDRPLVGTVARLTAQKGVHLIKHAIHRTLDRGGQFVLLGSAPDPRIQRDFQDLANQLHNAGDHMARLCLTYDEPLSHLIYAGADFILVPSIFEPCGLTQLIAMRYGCIPIVRKTGGLNDTVFDVDNDRGRAQAQQLEPNGFTFEFPDVAGVDYALNRALSGWYDNRTWFYSMCKRVMEQDWSWNKPALDYMELYHCARK